MACTYKSGTFDLTQQKDMDSKRNPTDLWLSNCPSRSKSCLSVVQGQAAQECPDKGRQAGGRPGGLEKGGPAGCVLYEGTAESVCLPSRLCSTTGAPPQEGRRGERRREGEWKLGGSQLKKREKEREGEGVLFQALGYRQLAGERSSGAHF